MYDSLCSGGRIGRRFMSKLSFLETSFVGSCTLVEKTHAKTNQNTKIQYVYSVPYHLGLKSNMHFKTKTKTTHRTSIK
jgi:hypothetical protein